MAHDRAGRMTMAAQPKPGSRLQAADVRILDAAVRLFARHGYDAVSTARIGQEAGISQSVVHYHFETKEKLWRAAMLHLFRQIGIAGRTTVADVKDLDPVSRLKVAVRRFIRLSARHPELGMLIMREGAEGGERLDWLVRHALRDNYAIYVGMIETAQRAGALKAYPPFHLTILIHAASSMLFNLQPLVEAVQERPLAEFDLDSVADMIIDTLFHGLTTSSPPPEAP